MDSGSDEGSDEEYTNGHQNLTNGHLENGVSDGSEVSEEEEDNNDSESEKEEVYGKQEVDNGDSGSEQGSEDQNDREGSNRDSESEGEENGQNDQELEEDEVSSMSDEPAEEETKQVGLKASEESYGRGEARESDNESDNGEEMEDEEQEDGEDEEEDDAEDEDEEQDDAEDEEQESPTKSTGSDEEDSSPISKKGRGRPKKHQAAYSDEETASTNNRNNKQIMKDEEIARSLNDSSERSRSRKASRKIALDEEDEDDEPLGKRKAKYDDDDDDFEDDGEDEEEDEEIESDDDDSDEQPKKRRKIEEDDNRRRSGRERKAPKKFEVEVDKTKKRKKKRKHESSSANDESDSDYDVKKRKGRKKKTKKKAKPKTKAPERAKRKRTKVQSSDENSEASADDISEDEGTVKRYKAKMKREKSKLKISRQDYEDKQSERHKGKQRVKYADDDTSHDSDIDSTYDVHDAEVEDEDVEQIGFVLDYRIGKKGATGESTMHFTVQEHGDPNLTLETEETEDQYLIKWDGWAHFNNTWESNQSLENRPNNKPVKGIRKLQNYVNKVRDYTRWKKMATPEDVEYQEVEVELGRNLLKTYLEPERIFAEKINPETGGTDYYVKWKNLPYSESTWEDPSIVKSYYPTYFEEYLARKKSKSNPKNYKETIKLIKKTWKPMKEQPDYIGSETLRLRDYQMDGINFLLDAWHKGNSMILADEMGLGKTIQTISFLKYLFHNYKFKGPMLVSVPLSTLAAWQKEFETWAPEMNVIAYIGDGKSREIIRQYECEDQESGELIFNVLLTNYEMVGKDRDFFVDIAWSNIVIDEAHRLKNHDSLLYKVLMDIESHHRLLLTGTPLQNSLKELWCLLNYIQIPDLDPWEVFEINYGSKKDQELGYVKLHTLLKPFIIRRLKKDVEKSLPGKVERILRVDMTVAQKRMYKNVLTRNFDVLSKGKNQISLLNLMMQLRKTCNHSHLLMEPEEIPQNDADRCKQLVYGSGKLVLLDKLLARFREKGDRVLIFSQMVTMLNIIEEYLLLRRYQFQRLDGSVSADKRKQSIARFNNPDSTDFCFLLSTKAGGLGINLQTANRVIIFDSDFNPQNDLQAIARAHRIGQKEEVKIYRLVSSNSVDEDIIQRAKNKMVLDHLVIQRMDTTGKTIIGGGTAGSEKDKSDGKNLSKQDLNMILKFGAEELFKEEENEGEKEENEGEIDLDAILEQAEVREEADDDAHQSEANKELLGAFKCTTLTFEETEKEVEQVEPPKETKNWDDIIPKELRKEEKKEPSLSDLEELFNPIAHRRKKRIKRRAEDDSAENSKVNTPVGSHGNTPVGSSYENSEDEPSDDDSGNDSEMEIELKKALKKKEIKGERGNYNKKNFMCTKCGKTYTDKKGVILHMSVKHQEPNYVLTDDNYIEVPENGVDDTSNKSQPLADGTVKKRGKKPMNTRCFPCGKAFSMRPGYKAHIKKVHDNIEPPENTDPANLALPDNRISCLICAKKFSNKNGLRHHISRVHLGIATKNDKGSGSEDEDEKDDAVSVEQDPLADPLGDVPVDAADADMDPVPTPENPNPFTCAVTNCTSAFPAKAFLLLHIKTQHPGVDTSEITLNTKLKLLQNGNSASNSVKSDNDSLPQSQVTEEEMVLIEKMMNSMRKYGCSLCEQRFTSKDKMTRHEKQHAKGNPVVCPYCGKSYSRRDKLVTHCKNTHADKPIPAPATRRSPEKPAAKKKSTPKILPKKAEPVDPDVVNVEVKFEKAANSERIKCPNCDLTFAFMKGAQRHLKQVHGPPRAFKCKECPLSYHDYKGLYQHTSRIHKRKSADTRDAQSNSDSVESDSAGSFVVDENGLDVEPADKKFKCGGCPKSFNNSGQLYLHKKTQHPHLIRTYQNSPLVNKDGSPATEPAVPPPPAPTKKFPCKQCPRIYGSYMSLYMHRKTKHTQAGGDSPARNGVSGAANGGVTVINLGTPGGNQDQKKPHQCLSCPKRYTDLKGLSKHIEDVHNAPVIVQPTFAPSPEKESQRVQCPYCPKIYSRRDKVNQHIRTVHPDKEVPRSPVKVSNVLKPIGITPMTNGDDDDIICLDDDVGDVSINNSSKGGLSGRGKYKEKAFRCPECNKGYCDKKRLDVHIENRHTTKSDDPFADVGPNTDIAVSSNRSEIGYEVYKVIGVYTTGVRFKCAKYSPISHDRWTLTEEINKNVMKVNIMKVLKTLKKHQVEKNVYTMDMDELVSLMQTASVDNGEKEVDNDDEDNDDEELDTVDDSKEITGIDENGLHSEIDIVDEDVLMSVQ